MSRWKVQFRSTSPHWAARFHDHFNFATVWDEIPWNDYLTERETNDEGSARDQYEGLCKWAESHEQPIKDVRLFHAGDSQWLEVASPEEP